MQSQADTLAQKAPAEPPGKDTLVLVPSELQPTAEQEQAMLHFAKTRRKAITTDLGRDDYSDDPGMSTSAAVLQRAARTFMGRRHLAHMIFAQQMEWRAQIMGGIYEHTNIHMPMTTRIVSQQIARAVKSYFGTSPWFAASATNSIDDAELARDINAYLRHKLDTVSHLSQNLATAVELAFIQGESVVKTGAYKLSTFFESYKTIAMDPASGKPYVAEDGDYIYQTDTFVPQPNGEEGTPEFDPAYDPAAAPLVLARDKMTPQPPLPLQFTTQKITVEQTLLDEIRSRPIYYLDFLCPKEATDVQTADMVVHMHKTQVIELANRLLHEAYDGAPPEERLQKVARLASQLLNRSTTDTTTGAASARSRPELGEQTQIATASPEPMADTAEQWIWYDIFGDGVQRSILLITDESGDIPIYYNYVGNVTEDGHRPFDVIRINPVPNRWHGMGNVEGFWDLQSTLDLIINRWAFGQSRSARIDFWQRDALVDADDMDLNFGGTFELRPGKEAKDAYQGVYLNDNKSADHRAMAELLMQAMQSRGAVANINDASMAGMDTGKLATGVKNLEKSGEEMFQLWMFHSQPGVESVLRRAARVALDRLKKSRPEQSAAIRFFDRQTSALITLDASRLPDLELDVKLELTTYKSQSQMTQAQMGYNMLAAYWANQNPIFQERSRPLVVQFLRALEVLNGESMVAPPSPEEQMMITPPMPGQEAPGGGIPTPTQEPTPIQ